jgi:hypothetical protein
MWPFKTKPAPPGIIIRSVLGEEIDRVEGWNLENKILRDKNWNHVDLSGMCLDGSDLSGSNLLGANLRNASLRNCKLVDCEISYADVSGCHFDGSDLKGCLMWRTETYRARFENILMDDTSDIPARRVVGGSMSALRVAPCRMATTSAACLPVRARFPRRVPLHGSTTWPLRYRIPSVGSRAAESQESELRTCSCSASRAKPGTDLGAF